MARRTNSGPARPLRWAVPGIVLVLAIAIGLTASAATPAVTITKLTTKPDVVPGEKVTYILIVRATRDVTVTVTDTLPYGVEWAGNLSPPEASYADGQVTWSGALSACETVVIYFDALVVKPETIGPLPIVNTACADDGTEEICSSVTICSRCRKIYMPFIVQGDDVPPWLGE